MRQNSVYSALYASVCLIGACLTLVGFCLPWVISPVYPELFSFSLLDRLLNIRPRGATIGLETLVIAALFAIGLAALWYSLAWLLRRRRMTSTRAIIMLMGVALCLVIVLDFTWFNPAAPLFTFPSTPRTPGAGQAVSAAGSSMFLLSVALYHLGNRILLREA